MLLIYDLGVRNFLIRGFDPLNDAADYDGALLPTRPKKPPGVRRARIVIHPEARRLGTGS